MLYFEEDYADLIEENDDIDLGGFMSRLMSATSGDSIGLGAIPILVFLSILAMLWFVAATIYVIVCLLIRVYCQRSRTKRGRSMRKRGGDSLARRAT